MISHVIHSALFVSIRIYISFFLFGFAHATTKAFNRGIVFLLERISDEDIVEDCYKKIL